MLSTSPRILYVLMLVAVLRLVSLQSGEAAAADGETSEVGLLDLLFDSPAQLPAFLKEHRPAQEDLDRGLEFAANEDDLASAKLLLDAGANVDAHGHYPHDSFPLQNAAYHGDIALVRLLLKRGANVNRRDVHGWTAFFLAAIHKRWGTLEVLAQWKGCRQCLRGTHGETPLHMAVLWREPDAISYLLRKTRVRKQVKDDDGFTALELALRDLQFMHDLQSEGVKQDAAEHGMLKRIVALLR